MSHANSMTTENKPKRILIFSLAYYPYVGGAEVAIKEITSRINPEEVCFHLITLRFDNALPREEHIGNVLVYRVGWGNKDARGAAIYRPLFYLSKVLFVPLAALKAWRLNRENRYDGFWAMMTYMLFPIAILRFLGVRVPYALTLQEGDPFEEVFERPHIALFKKLLVYGFRNATVVQVISTYLAGWARRMEYPGTPVVIPNGVDLSVFTPRPSQEKVEHARRLLSEQLAVGEKDILLVTVSRLVKKNAIGDIVEALALLPPDAKLLVVGEGPLKNELKKRIRKKNLEKQAAFLYEPDQGNIPAYFHLSKRTVFVRPSLSEGLGNAFLEAMAAKVPVVGTHVGGIPDFLTDYETGRVVSPHRPEEIAEAVRWYAENPEKRDAIIEQAYAMVRERFAWSAIAERMQKDVFAKLT